MRWLDELHLKYPFLGARRLRDELNKRGRLVNRKRVTRLMRVMGLEALYPKKRTSKPNALHRRLPYRLKGLAITRPNRIWPSGTLIWATDVTVVPMAHGFLYLVVVIDWACRAFLETVQTPMPTSVWRPWRRR